MEITNAAQEHVSIYADQLPDLFHATGPVTYSYQFGDRAVFDTLVRASWETPGTLFAYDETTLALEDGELLGIETGFLGTGFEARKKALAPLWQPLIASGEIDLKDLKGIGQRTYQCSFLNPSLRADVYYIHALAVRPECQGKGVGARLFRNAMENARQAGFKGLQLDVLSDNPAVEFYHAMGLECIVETLAPTPHAHGVPMERRMAVRF